jgi:N-acetylglucosaminyldiphosphoundecaprenol N-acetyl-beta-D-mannosaminyltransferase
MGIKIASIAEAAAVAVIIEAAIEGRGIWTITANLDHLRRYRSEPLAKQLIDSADLVVADGAPLTWASRLAGARLPARVAGSNLIWSISEAASHRNVSMFLLGGDPNVAERAACILRERYSGLEIVGTLCPPFGFENDEQMLERIRHEVTEANPRLVLVGLGFPKQDIMITHLRKTLPRASFIGVGISFSFVAGDVPRAPRWMHTLGLEWAYRLAQEPRRLANRYLVLGVPFALRLLGSAARYRMRNNKSDTSWAVSQSELV